MIIEELEKQNIVLSQRLLELQEAQFCLLEQYLMIFHSHGQLFATSVVNVYAEHGILEIEMAYWDEVAKRIREFYEMIKNAKN